MTFLSLHLPALILLGLAGTVWLLYNIQARLAVQQSRKAFKEQHGCKDPRPPVRRWDIFGLYGLYNVITAAREHRLLEFWEGNFKLYGSTHGGGRRGRRFFITKEVENFKAIHATNFDDW